MARALEDLSLALEYQIWYLKGVAALEDLSLALEHQTWYLEGVEADHNFPFQVDNREMI